MVETPRVPALKAEKSLPAEAKEECTLQTPLKPGIPGSPGNLIASARNPNGDSELSDLMRKMVADLQGVRQQIMNGALPESFPSGHDRIRCTWPTDLDGRNEIFDAMAQQYLNAYKALADSKADTAKAEIEARYAAVVGSCVTCHENSCRGPIPMIKNLHLSQAPNP